MHSSIEQKVHNLHKSNNNTITQQPQQRTRFKEYSWWFRVFLYIIFLLGGQCAATLLGKLYYDNGGNSKWMITIVQKAGFPLLFPLYFYNFPSHDAKLMPKNDCSSKGKPKIFTLFSIYLAFGIFVAINDFLYAYGLLYLPSSTFALLCASQLAFSALFSFFLNSQKFTPFIFNSIVLITLSVSLLAINVNSEDSIGIHREKYFFGVLFTLGASAAFALHLTLVQLCFEKVIKSETFSVVLDMQFYPSFFAICVCILGLFLSGEWKSLDMEMKEYEKGSVSYIMTLFWTALTWQISSIGLFGLIFEVSSLFSIVISSLELPIMPFLAFVFFHDKINGVKVIALLLAIWGFLSYMYQYYLDDKKTKIDKSDGVKISKGDEEETC